MAFDAGFLIHPNSGGGKELNKPVSPKIKPECKIILEEIVLIL